MKKVLLISAVVLGFTANAQWTAVNFGLTDFNITSFAVQGSNIFVGTQTKGIFLSTNNGNTWTAVNNGITGAGFYTLAFAVDGTNIFAGTQGGIFLSTDSGSNWTAVNNGLTNTVVFSLAISGTNIFAGTQGGVFLSTNNGGTWTSLISLTTRALAISGTNIFAGCTGGTGISLSTDNGTSWIPVNSGLPSTDIYALATIDTNIFAGTNGGGVFLSTNNGTLWTLVNNGMTNSIINSLAVNGSDIFAGTLGGVFFSGNNGNTWSVENTGLTNLNVHAFAFSGSNIFAGTFGFNGGVFIRSLTEMGIEENYFYNSISIFPNPFSIQTTLWTANPVHNATLTVDNCFGQTVAQIKNISGQIITFNRDNLASGLYFVRLTTPFPAGEGRGEVIAVDKLVITDK